MKFGRVAVLGRGSAALRATQGLQNLIPDLEVVSVASLRPDGFEGVHVPSISSLESCGPIDWVFDCSPSSERLRNAEQLAPQEIPTLFEKPLARCLEDGRAILRLYEANQTLIRVGYSLRKLQAYLFLKKLLEEGAVGEILAVEICCGQYLPDWRPGRDYRSTASAQKKLGGGVLLELSHEINYAIGLFGPASSVRGSLKNSGELDIDVEDWAEGKLEMGNIENPTAVKLNLDFLRKKKERWCRVSGGKGEIFWDLVQNSVRGNHSGADFSNTFDDSIDESYSREILEMRDQVAEDRGYSGDSKDSMHTLEVVEAWRLSHKDEKKVSLIGVESDV